MGNVPYLDFQAIKRSYSMEEIMALTGLAFKKDGKSFRCSCPVHKGGPRSLVVSPAEKDDKGDTGVFFCHAANVGGDRVALLAHVRDAKPYGIFKELAESRPAETPKAPPPAPATVPEEKEKEARGTGLPPLPYLESDHDAVRAMGFRPDIAKALGIGFAPRGLHKQRLAVPLRLADGRLAGYLSIPATTSVQLPPKWHL
jgi:hypothetical protein